MPELLIELLSEEIPARMQARAAEDFKSLILDGLKAAGLGWDSAHAHATPRRLALVVDEVPERTADVREDRRGPRDGAPDAAVQGFLKANGLTSLDQCERRDTGKGVFWFVTIDRPGRDTVALLPQILTDVLLKMPWPKSMRFGHSPLLWVRPLQSILVLFDARPVHGALALGDSRTGRQPRLLTQTDQAAHQDDRVIRFGDTTVGHRFLAPGPLRVTGFADYRRALGEASVILDREERKAWIMAEATRLAAAEGLSVRRDDGLLEEVAGLVEWPTVLIGGFDPDFLEVPAEALTTSMRVNQKYFALERADESLAPRFIVVANRPTADGGATIVAGNERVLRARLADARFFWDQDRLTPLEERLPDLDKITFHARLGTVRDKVERVRGLAAGIVRAIGLTGAPEMLVDRAALLCKADLVTGMVGEFPDLQGIMGRHYALAEGEATEVADAIADHYRPLGPSDRCPTALVSVALALADKLDTLVGFFAIDEKPTGSKDPFALRRAGLGSIRLIVENGLRVGLRHLFAVATEAHLHTLLVRHPERAVIGGERPIDAPITAEEFDGLVQRMRSHSTAEVIAFIRQNFTESEQVRFIEVWDRFARGSDDLLSFFADRLKVALKERGVRQDLIDAVFALGGEDDLVRLLSRVDALQALLRTEDGANLLTAYRRAANIVRIEEKKDGREYLDVVPGLFVEPEETELGSALEQSRATVGAALAAEDFASAMRALAGLRRPVDQFFDRVTVNATDAGLRANRLALLRGIMATMGEVAEFSRIEG